MGQQNVSAESVQLPNIFTIHSQTSQPNEFTLRGGNRSDFSIKLEDTDTDESRLSLFSNHGHLLGTIRHFASYRQAEITIPGTPSAEFRMTYRFLASRQAVHDFSDNIAEITSRSGIEWRNNGTGWRLVSNDGEEVLATGALNIGTKKAPRFELYSGVDDEKWKLVVILSWLKIWDKVRIAMIGVSEGG